ncbi:hypothetical protein KUCAC02_005564 [Chaenocephalus aceratus]|uniref:Uncharacterized protein n=1 Tax=Chaenocephalus aceratus TaxID=36190 RepID=A0ACB9WPQ0_CHAAC|nr:hypothetical protein KUCAC02_005564 [Chaenocephalus aceratus]
MSEFLVSLFGERLVNSEKAEVDVQSLGAKLSLVGLFFGCSLNAPCKQFNGSLCEFYTRFKKACEHKDKLEIVFISSDQDQKHWQDFCRRFHGPPYLSKTDTKSWTAPGLCVVFSPDFRSGVTLKIIDMGLMCSPAVSAEALDENNR